MTAGRDEAPGDGRCVIVVGAVNIDLVVAAPRLPGPGETVVGGGVSRHGGGKGANAAVAAARAGGSVRLIGAVGADDDGVRALEELRAEGIDVSDVAVLRGEATGVALIVVDSAGENQIAVGAGANMALTAGHVRAAMARALPRAGCVLVSTEISGEAVVAAVEAATAAGVPCVLNPAPVISEVIQALRYGPILTPNATESADLAERLGRHLGAAPAKDAVATGLDSATVISARTGAPVIVTLGGQGALIVTPAGASQHVPACAARVCDTTGAGDTFNGVLATRIAEGCPPEEAMHPAMVAAALSVSQLGARAGMPSAAAIAAVIAAELQAV